MCLYAECHYAECHYAECHHAECRGALPLSQINRNINTTGHRIHAKIVYDGPAHPTRQPASARSARSTRRKRTAIMSAPHVSPVTIYAKEVYTNSYPDRYSAKPATDEQFFAVAYNDYGPVIPAPAPIEDTEINKPSSYNYPHLRVIPPTPVPVREG